MMSLMQNAGMPLEKVSNAAKNLFDALFQAEFVVCQNDVRGAVGMIGGARPSTRCGLECNW
jgi:hypothetical protein